MTAGTGEPAAPTRPVSGRLPGRRGLLAVLVGGAVVLAPLAALAGLDGLKEHLRAVTCLGRPRPAPTGPFGVGTATIDVDAGPEGGEIPVSLYYPGDAGPPTAAARLAEALDALAHPTRARSRPGAPPARAGAPWPLLIYFPSWFSHRHESSFTLANLASLGFVVAGIDDVARLPPVRGDDADVQRRGTEVGSEADFAAARALAGRRAALEARLGSAVLTRILESRSWGGRVDRDRVAAIGFSFGGSAAAAMGHADPRIRAVVNLDGSLFGDVAEAGPQVPYLTLLAGDSFPSAADLHQPDLAARFESILDREAIDRQLVLDARPETWTLVVDRTTHLDFSDRLVMPAFNDRRGPDEIDRLATWRDLNAAVAGFLDGALRGRPRDAVPGPRPAGALRTLEAAHRDAVASATPPDAHRP